MENKIIEANAGAGKTYELVERMIEAMREGTCSRAIVALTFSRAAAGEIFSRFVKTLAERGEFAFLREVVETQHLSLVGTIDSFLMRYLQAFPLELGLSGDIGILEGYTEQKACENSALSLLSSDDQTLKSVLLANFRIWDGDDASRSYLDKFSRLVKSWHSAYLAIHDPDAWGEASRIWGDNPPRELSATLDEIHAFAPRLEEVMTKESAKNFIADIRDFSGKKLPRSIPKVFERNPGALEIAESAVRCAMGYMLNASLQKAKGIFALMHLFEKEYGRLVRSRGLLTFQDMPRAIASLGAFERIAIDYRLDAKIVHWALDEFQDTSRDQWNSIRSLVHEARFDRHVFIVGDKKQAIYGWRSGDETIFDEERESGLYASIPLTVSYRYRKEISQAVDRVFDRNAIGDISGDWPCAEHTSKNAADRGFVHVVTADGSRMADFFEPIINELEAIRPWERNLKCAILVRKNDFGINLCNELLKAGIPAVWEGKSAILDTPVLNAFVALVRLAEHPGDELSFSHIKATPLYRALYPDPARNPDAGEVSRDASRMLTTLGLGRMLLSIRLAIADDAWDAFTESRFADLVRAAAKFEASLSPDSTYGDFPEFLESVTRRDSADTSSVRILTIHHSKGLTFDYTLVPVYEHEGMDTIIDQTLVNTEAPWVLPDFKKEFAQFSGATSDAFEQRRMRAVNGALCVWYVAMTRSKYALTLILPKPPKTESSLKFSGIVRRSGLETNGDERWYQAFPATERNSAQSKSKPFVRPAMVNIPRGEGDGSQFVQVRLAPASKAAAHGVKEHAKFEKIEWLPPENAATPLEKALVKDPRVFELWREKPYEIFDGGKWQSGRFDRVEFFRDQDGEVGARILDFKTDAIRTGETPFDFETRMTREYEPQMARYRHALSLLTGLPMHRISSRLLFTALG